MTQNVSTVMEVTQVLSDNVGAYIIFISLVFLICFLFLGYQLLGIFKAMLCKMMDDVFKKLETIESEIREIKSELRR